MDEHKDTKDVLTKKDVHALLWRGRDFELTNLWQRSIFLATFLVLIFTAYLGLWSAVMSRMHDTQAYVSSTHYSPRGLLIIEASQNPGSAASLIAVLSNSVEFGIGFFVLSLLGSSFSILWIFMAKGSKYWYERYETSISAIEEDTGLFCDEINHDWEREEIEARLQNREEQHIPIHGNLRKGKTNSFLLSPKGGAYSVSKVNILIGVVFLLFWLIAQIFHVGILCNQSIPCCGWIIAVVGIPCLNALLIALLGWRVSSGEAGLWKSLCTPLMCGCLASRKDDERKEKENTWLASRLKERNFGEYAHAFKSINMENKYSKNEPVPYEKLCEMVNMAMRMNKATQMLYHLEEHVIAYAFPKGMQHSWESDGRVVKLTSEDPAILRDEWKEQMLDVCILHASNFPKKEITVRVFSDIPWSEINTEGALKVSTEDYSSWNTTFVLCEHGYEDTAICTETFQFRKNSGKDGVDCLNSTIHWMESNKKQEFNWNILPDPNQEDTTRTKEGDED